jgi:hypothetical protein
MSHDHVDKDELEDALAPEPSAEELRSVVEEISAHYPPPRLGTELVLLEVNPHRAHAYWNIDVDDYRSARQRTGLENPPLVLRLFDITDGTPPEQALTAFDVEVQGLQGHWYLDLWKDGRTHLADIGFRDASGRLVALARSNAVSTPSSAESPDYHTLAVDTTHPEGLRITDLVLDPHLSDENTDVETGAALELAAPAFAAAAPNIVSHDLSVEVAPATVAFQASGPTEPTRVPWPNPPAAPPPEKMQADVQAYFDHAAERAAAAPVSSPWQGHGPDVSPALVLGATGQPLPEGWPSAEQLKQLIPAGTMSAPASEPVSTGPVEGNHEPTSAGPAHAPAAAPAPAPTPVSLDQYVGLSSFEHGRREVALEINVELHIYGRAKPGTELSLYGQPVPLRPDGTFSIHKPLPQGAVVLPLLAVDPPPASKG